MILKTLYGLQAALLASNNLLHDTTALDINKTTEENKKNKEYLTSKSTLFEPKETETKKANLLLPVNLMIFDKYYKRLSEWKYTDKYTYDDNVLVFNAKEHDPKSTSEEEFYKSQWLTGLEHPRVFNYDKKFRVSQYPYNDNVLNPNWIDGKSSSHKLEKLLSLNTPTEIKGPFSMHDKIIELNQPFLMKSEIKLFSGYWKQGELNNSNNVIDQIEYGNLKKESLHAQNLYHDYWQSKSCDSLKTREDRFLKESRKRVTEGFDSQCDRINLLDFYSFFWDNRSRSIYSSGYVSYKTKNPASWNRQYLFYSLGNWSLDRPSKVKVNEEENDKKLWYVDFDDVFVPEIKWVEEGTTKKNSLQLSFYINYDKVKDVESFLRIASALKYKLQFNLNAKKYEVKFTLKEILEDKKFPVFTDEKDVALNASSNLAFSNFEVTVYSENSGIKLSSKGGTEFKFKPNLSIVQSRFSVFRYLAIDQEQFQNFYFSELKKKQRLDKLFYFVSKKPSNLESEAIALSSEWASLLDLSIVGSDYSSAATLKFYDFLAGEYKTLELSNLLSLPKFEEESFLKKESFSSLENLITSQSKQKIGSYFWDNIELHLEEKDLLSGIEKYSLKRKTGKDNTDLSWETHYKGKYIKVKNELDKYLVLKTDFYKFNEKLAGSRFGDLFSVDARNIENLSLAVSDFSFNKVHDTSDFIELEAEYKKPEYVSDLKLDGRDYKGVKLTGKSKFKISKRDGYHLTPEQSIYQSTQSSPFSFNAQGSPERGNQEAGWLEKTTLPLIVSSAVAGGGVTAGIGALLSKKLGLFF